MDIKFKNKFFLVFKRSHFFQLDIQARILYILARPIFDQLLSWVLYQLDSSNSTDLTDFQPNFKKEKDVFSHFLCEILSSENSMRM